MEHVEPAFEHCMKMQRMSGVNRYVVLQEVATLSEENFFKLIRVVPPESFGPLCGQRTYFFTLFYGNPERNLEMLVNIEEREKYIPCPKNRNAV